MRADTAGGCEEVVAVGSGIGTGAGTSVNLNKRGEADEAAKNIGWAGGATEEQANCIWLISVETVTLNFL